MSSSMSGCQALEEWCRLLLNSYPGVNITNMTSSWSDGRAFCALIHSHRPDLIPWDIVSYNAQKNCQLAFTIAEQKLGITCLLDVCDVARAHPPDRLSILTYVSQFYHRFQSDTTDSGISSPSSESRRGGVHSLLSNRRSRSVSASPPIEKENPFRREFLENSKAEKSPCQKLVNKLQKHKNNNIETVVNVSDGDRARGAVRLRHQNKEKENNRQRRQRLVQSMFVEKPSQDENLAPKNSSFDNNENKPGKSSNLLSKPRPYCRVSSQTQPLQSISILSKTQNYLQERRKRSQSQPPVDKSEKRKFDFLSTENFNPTSSKKVDRVLEKNQESCQSNTLKSTFEKQKNMENLDKNISVKTENSVVKRQNDTQKYPTLQFCNMRKFEFALQTHRRFVQTLV